MKPGRWRKIRLSIASAVFILFLFASFSSSPPALIISRILSRIQLAPAILRASGIPEALTGAAEKVHPAVQISAVSGAAAALIILLSAYLFGRVYCSLICPIGLFQDVFIDTRRKMPAGRFRFLKPFNSVRFGILLLCTGAAFAGIMMPLILLEPYSIWGRFTLDIAHPLSVLAGRAVFTALRPFGIFINLIRYNFNLPVFAVTFLTALTLIFFALKKGRVYCSLVCPAGTLLGLFSRKSLRRVAIDPLLCTSCGLCEKKCRTGCIDSKGKTVDSGRCVMCGDCLTGCPADAIKYSKKAPAKSVKNRQPYNRSRRTFLGTLKKISGASLSALIIPSWLIPRTRIRGLTPEGEANTPSTPPGSKGINHFSSLCIACHRCVSVCPANVLQPSLFEYGIKGILQPVMDYRSGFCEFECTLCTHTCPTGAIIPLTAEVKKSIQIGRVYFEKDKCVVVTGGTICGACAEGCPTHAVGMEPYKNGLDIPVTDNSLCVGCGSCEYICPVPEKAIYVKGLEVHGKAEVREPLYRTPKDTSDEGFPF